MTTIAEARDPRAIDQSSLFLFHMAYIPTGEN